VWVNKNFINIVLYWDGPFASHLFIPLSYESNWQYFNGYEKNIIETDSVNNNICYVSTKGEDSISDSINVVIETLLTYKTKSIQISTSNSNSIYPFIKIL